MLKKHFLLLSSLLCCLIFEWKLWTFFRILCCSKEQHLFEIAIFCYIVNVFTVTVDQFNASLLNKIIYLKKKWKWKFYLQAFFMYYDIDTLGCKQNCESMENNISCNIISHFSASNQILMDAVKPHLISPFPLNLLFHSKMSYYRSEMGCGYHFYVVFKVTQQGGERSLKWHDVMASFSVKFQERDDSPS